VIQSDGFELFLCSLIIDSFLRKIDVGIMPKRRPKRRHATSLNSKELLSHELVAKRKKTAEARTETADSNASSSAVATEPLKVCKLNKVTINNLSP